MAHPELRRLRRPLPGRGRVHPRRQCHQRQHHMRSEEQDLSDGYTECPSIRQEESPDPGYVSACDVHQSSIDAIDALTREVDGRLAKIENLLAYMQIRSFNIDIRANNFKAFRKLFSAQLQPLYNPKTGKPIDGFPRSICELDTLDRMPIHSSYISDGAE
ncbi:hypothetical protein BKA56DRAFT_679105 [Ilyonectria sp. MPI-CAGE-AT-0026]|nr:hypothetical protein BKA56DRAFT_679105 [Ilyonectria sp. MPI-CAGE-AT-0026]